MKSLIAFFEIPSVDFHRAVDFYSSVFGVELSVSECEEEKMACFVEQGEAIGAIFYAPGYSPSENGIIIDFNCENIDSTLDKVLQKGGKVVISKTKIQADGKGYFALFTDSEGNRVGIYADK